MYGISGLSQRFFFKIYIASDSTEALYPGLLAPTTTFLVLKDSFKCLVFVEFVYIWLLIILYSYIEFICLYLNSLHSFLLVIDTQYFPMGYIKYYLILSYYHPARCCIGHSNPHSLRVFHKAKLRVKRVLFSGNSVSLAWSQSCLFSGSAS